MDKDPRVSMKGAPCGKRIFKKCVGVPWDGKNGCPYWQEMLVTVQEGKNKFEVVRSQCVELWQFDAVFWSQNRLSGIQGATESFRNEIVPATATFAKLMVTAIEAAAVGGRKHLGQPEERKAITQQ